MVQWLRQDLARTTRQWKIAYWHAPPYTKGTHDSDLEWDTSRCMIQMRENVLPIIESYGVDVVLCGHSHVYERSWLLNAHYGYSWTFSETNKVDAGDGRESGDGAYRKQDHRGTVYVVAGVGAGPTGFYTGLNPAMLVNIEFGLGSCLLDVSSNRLDFSYINTDTNVLDSFTIIKDPLRILDVDYASNRITLTWNSTLGQKYRVYMQTQLDGPKTMIADQVPAEGKTTSWSGALPPGNGCGFFSVSTCP